MSLCPKCGHLLDDDDQFCSKCGARVGGTGSAPPPPLPDAPEYGPHSAPQPQYAQPHPTDPQQRFSTPQHRPIEPEPVPSRAHWANAGTVLLILLVLAAVGLVAYLLIPHSPAFETSRPREIVAESDSIATPVDADKSPEVTEPADSRLKPIGHTDVPLPSTTGGESAPAAKGGEEVKAVAGQHDESSRPVQEPSVREVPQQVYKSVEQMPMFPGGDAALMKYISSHLQYPAMAQDSHIEGTVVVQFVVTKTGKVGEVKVVRSVDRNLDKEAIRVCRSLPNFVPGRQDGQAVNVWYTLPVKFKLQQ